MIPFSKRAAILKVYNWFVFLFAVFVLVLALMTVFQATVRVGETHLGKSAGEVFLALQEKEHQLLHLDGKARLAMRTAILNSSHTPPQDLQVSFGALVIREGSTSELLRYNESFRKHFHRIFLAALATNGFNEYSVAITDEFVYGISTLPHQIKKGNASLSYFPSFNISYEQEYTLHDAVAAFRFASALKQVMGVCNDANEGVIAQCVNAFVQDIEVAGRFHIASEWEACHAYITQGRRTQLPDSRISPATGNVYYYLCIEDTYRSVLSPYEGERYQQALHPVYPFIFVLDSDDDVVKLVEGEYCGGFNGICNSGYCDPISHVCVDSSTYQDAHRMLRQTPQ